MHDAVPKLPASVVDNPNIPAVEELYYVCQGTEVDRGGDYGGNAVSTADFLYDGIYHKEQVVALHGITHNPLFPDALPALERPMPRPPETIPSRKDFIEVVRDAITRRRADHEASLYEGAHDVIRAMADGHHPAAIWTTGDHSDGQQAIPPDNQPHSRTVAQRVGSFDQLKKIAGGGFAQIRRELARAALADGQKLTPAALRDTLGIFASSNKFSPQTLDALATYFIERNVHHVVALEDRARNIARLQTELAARGVTVHGIFVRQGRHGEDDNASVPPQTQAVDSLAQASEIIREYQRDEENTFGFISDFDGVLSNQARRRKLQASAVALALAERRWI